MRTKSSRLAEQKLETYGSMSLIIGSSKILFSRHIGKPLSGFYERHPALCLSVGCGVLGFVLGVIL